MAPSLPIHAPTPSESLLVLRVGSQCDVGTASPVGGHRATPELPVQGTGDGSLSLAFPRASQVNLTGASKPGSSIPYFTVQTHALESWE